jgi:hypothetical protein
VDDLSLAWYSDLVRPTIDPANEETAMPLTIDRSLRLPANQFMPPAAQKTGICIHHTVGGSAPDKCQVCGVGKDRFVEVK